jgi:hypothetical protein
VLELLCRLFLLCGVLERLRVCVTPEGILNDSLYAARLRALKKPVEHPVANENPVRLARFD